MSQVRVLLRLPHLSRYLRHQPRPAATAQGRNGAERASMAVSDGPTVWRSSRVRTASRRCSGLRRWERGERPAFRRRFRPRGWRGCADTGDDRNALGVEGGADVVRARPPICPRRGHHLAVVHLPARRTRGSWALRHGGHAPLVEIECHPIQCRRTPRRPAHQADRPPHVCEATRVPRR
jgi:hypothetical protein